MTELLTYPQSQLPEKWFYQIISFLRIEFADGFVGDLQFRNWIAPADYSPMYLIIVHDEVLIAHTQVLSKTLRHEGQKYQVYGLSGVLTYPAFQGQGYGRQIVRAGTDYIAAQPDADIGVLTCALHNVGFYQKCGWTFITPRLLIGSETNPIPSEELAAVMCISENAQQHRVDFETVPLYWGEDLW